ncbi:hypothetical protein ACV566_16170 [Staphylococcus aureus]
MSINVLDSKMFCCRCWFNEHVLVTSSFQYQWAPNIEKFDFQFLLTMQVGGAQT